MLDNSKLIHDFFKAHNILPEEGKNGFYVYCELLSRKKDNGGKDFKFASFVFTSLSDYNTKVESIKNTCENLGMRAYIYLTSIKSKNVYIQMQKKMITSMENDYFDNTHTMFDSACGVLSSVSSKMWMVDFDSRDSDKLKQLVGKLHEYGSTVNIQLDSKNGYHLGVTKFKTDDFMKDETVKSLSEVFELKKNTPLVILCAS
jgi:hypothetical protein